MASSLDGTCPRDLLQGLVPLCVPTFMFRATAAATMVINGVSKIADFGHE